MTDIVIAAYRRSPFHFAGKGQLTRVRPDDLAAQVVQALVAETGIDAEGIEDVIVGCAFPEGEQGMNVARLVGFIAGLPCGRPASPSTGSAARPCRPCIRPRARSRSAQARRFCAQGWRA